jgi:predicted dehydrogenase
VENELIAFAQSVRSGVPHANSPEEALRDLTVVEALLQAAEQGRVVTVEQE